MAICPVCKTSGELCAECPKCHRCFIEEADLKKAPDDELLGTLIAGQYIPLALIGEGGMGRIYRGKAKYTGQTVALKILKSEYMEDETLKDRFFREAEVVSKLAHPNIVRLYGCAPVPEHNTIFMAMELLVGRTLFDVLKKENTPLPTMLRWFTQIASALGEAHKNGVFHRDMKPENVFIVKNDDDQEDVRVLDFGFARLQGAAKKLTMAGVAFGTPHYMSPEQAMGLTDITAAVDIYAVGVMLFQAISGKVPYDSPNNSPMDVMYAQVHQQTPRCVPRPEYAGQVPQRLISCIYKCMKKEPKDRFPDGHALCLELQAICDEIAQHEDRAKPTIISNTPVDVEKLTQKPAVNTTVILAIILAVILAIVVGVIVWMVC